MFIGMETYCNRAEKNSEFLQIFSLSISTEVKKVVFKNGLLLAFDHINIKKKKKKERLLNVTER